MRIIQGDCLQEMRKLKENSIDTVITDPPYGLSFMGKKWDYDVPSIEMFAEILRVAKPGATLLCFGGTRTYHRMACAVEDAGWQIRDCIMWLYSSGFPKATDISKQLDKGHKGKVIGEKRFGKTSTGQGSGWNPNAVAATGRQEVRELVSEEAKLWNGWKSHGLKPAYEPIIVAMKPNDGTYANNALKHGVSGLWIDGGRIGTERTKTTIKDLSQAHGNQFGKAGIKYPTQGYKENPPGRFPANVILECICDEVREGTKGEPYNYRGIEYENSKKAMFRGDKPEAPSNYNDTGDFHTNPDCPCYMLDEQSGLKASRFFYTAKASKAERNAGCEGLEEKQTTGGGGTNDPNGDDVCGKYGSVKAKASNFHPTIKPLKLMEYLCKLTKTPTGGVVLDPFMGSGTTGLACQNTGRDFIGIEKDEEYIKIAEARLKANEKLV